MKEAQGGPGRCLDDLLELRPKSEGFQEGQLVEAFGLKAAVVLNGLQGRTTGRWQDERIGVQFPAPHGLKALRPDNLRVVSDMPQQSKTCATPLEKLQSFLRSLEPRTLGSDDVFASCLKALPGLSYVMDDHAADALGTLPLLRELSQLVRKCPAEPFLIADLQSSRDPRNEQQLIELTMMCLPMWAHKHLDTPIAWFLLTDCTAALDNIYSDQAWQYHSKDIDSASVQHITSDMRAVWHDDSRILHALSFKCSQSDYPGLVVRILRCAEDRRSRDWMNRINAEKCPCNVLTLWILEESPLAVSARMYGLDGLFASTLRMSGGLDDNDDDGNPSTEDISKSYSQKKREKKRRAKARS